MASVPDDPQEQSRHNPQAESSPKEYVDEPRPDGPLDSTLRALRGQLRNMEQLQSVVSVSTLVLVIARAVNILK